MENFDYFYENAGLSSVNLRFLWDFVSPISDNFNTASFGGAGTYTVSASSSGIFDFDYTDPFEVSFSFSSNSSSEQALVGKRQLDATEKGWEIYLTSSGEVSFTLNNDVSSTNYLRISTNASYNDGLEHDVILKYDGGGGAPNITLTVDGVESNAVDLDGISSSITNTAVFCVGSRNVGAAYLDGKVWSVKINDQEGIVSYYTGGTDWLDEHGFNDFVISGSLTSGAVTNDHIEDTSELARHAGIVFRPTGVYSPDNAIDLFDNNEIKVSGAKDVIRGEQFTLMLDFEKKEIGSQKIFSSYSGDRSNSSGGFCFGTNEANKFYIESYGDKTETQTFSMDLAKRNIISLRKAHNKFTLSRLEPASSQVEHESLNVPSSTNFGRYDLYVGNTPLGVSKSKASGCVGEINGLAYIDKTVGNVTLKELFSGFLPYESGNFSFSTDLKNNYFVNRFAGNPALDESVYTTGKKEMISGLTEAIYTHIEGDGIPSARMYYTADYNDVEININGTVWEVINGKDNIIESTISSTIPFSSTTTAESDMSGVANYSLDNYGNMTMTNEVFYDDTPLGVEYKVYRDIYYKYATVELSAGLINTGDMQDYVMDGVALMSLTGSAWLLNPILFPYNPEDYNNRAETINYPASLSVKDTGNLSIYDPNGSYINPTGYSITNNRVFLSGDIEEGKYLYDNLNNSVGTSVFTLAANEDFALWKNGSRVFELGGETKRSDPYNKEYVEYSEVDLINEGSIQSKEALSLNSYSVESIVIDLENTTWE